jgi:hypothetical protein
VRALNALNANYPRVWFIPAAPDYWDPEQFVETWLDYRTDLLDEWRVGDFRLRLYATPSSFLNTMAKSGADFGDRFRLLGYRTRPRGENLEVVLYWRALANLQEDYAVYVRALDARGEPVGETSGPPARGAYPTHGWRKNEIVVDAHTVAVARDATSLQVRVCRAAGDKSCLRARNAEGSRGDALALPLQPP